MLPSKCAERMLHPAPARNQTLESFIHLAFTENLLRGPAPAQQGTTKGARTEGLKGVWGPKQLDDFNIFFLEANIS